MNPGPRGPEPASCRDLSCPLVSARFVFYSKWIFFVSSCDLVYPPGSVNAYTAVTSRGSETDSRSSVVPSFDSYVEGRGFRNANHLTIVGRSISLG